jgi:hypothetical protein
MWQQIRETLQRKLKVWGACVIIWTAYGQAGGALVGRAEGDFGTALGVLGYAVGRGAQTGKSAVPGVQKIVQAIRDGNALPPAALPGRMPAEVAPATAPGGRGDEAVPVR